MVAKVVKVIYLPDLPDKGDASDYLDQGHTAGDLQDLLAGALPFEPAEEAQDDRPTEPGRPDWKVSALLGDAIKITGILNSCGYFVHSGEDSYFFHQESRQLITLTEDDLNLRLLLGERFSINARDQLYGYLLDHLYREALVRGREALIRRFSYYDEDSHSVFLDMGDGRVLKITADAIAVRDNGADDVLFRRIWKHQPWTYVPPSERPQLLLYQQYIKQANFTEEDSELGVQDQQALFLCWLLSFAFESIMPTKVVAAAVGPSGSGKSSLFRNAGRILVGPRFEVSSLSKESEGEKDFWVALKHAFFRCYDNLDESVKWLPDALAQIATGAERPGRKKYTDEDLLETEVSCMLALTTRTPRASLRREDVATRTLLFKLKKLEEVTPEYKILAEIDRLRGQYLSDYASMLQKVLATPLEGVEPVDPSIRMADFARVATWIGRGLSDEMGRVVDEALTHLTASQNRFAVEEDPVASALEIWLGRSEPPPPGSMEMGGEGASNEGRAVVTSTLLSELNAIAREFGMRLNIASPEALGRYLRNHQQALAEEFLIHRPGSRSSRGKKWLFHFKDRDRATDAEN